MIYIKYPRVVGGELIQAADEMKLARDLNCPDTVQIGFCVEWYMIIISLYQYRVYDKYDETEFDKTFIFVSPLHVLCP